MAAIHPQLASPVPMLRHDQAERYVCNTRTKIEKCVTDTLQCVTDTLHVSCHHAHAHALCTLI